MINFHKNKMMLPAIHQAMAILFWLYITAHYIARLPTAQQCRRDALEEK